MTTHAASRYASGPGRRRGESRRAGQWKLAYADFLTALSALFLVLWLSSASSHDQRAEIAAYFTGRAAPSGAPVEHAFDATIEQDLLATLPADRVHVVRAGDRVRIELTDARSDPFFASGSGAFSPFGEAVLARVAGVLAPIGAPIEIEGHTDAFPAAGADFDNWSLSTARALAARRALLAAGVAPQRIVAVSGRADTAPLLPTQPHLPANRRVTIVLDLAD